jgi:hypothetical protein
METIVALHEAARPYYALVALVFTWVGLAVAWRRRRREWARKEFLGRVNFSLNTFPGTLAMRTLLEVDTSAVWPNAHGLKLLRKAAEGTTNADPFIRLADPDDRDFVHRSVKNAVSQLCPAAFVAAALGAPVRTGTFRFAVSCERYEEGMRTIKLRVILIEQGTLREWCGPGGKAEALDLPAFYRTRLKTLQIMYEMDQKAAAGGPDELGRVELGVPV